MFCSFNHFLVQSLYFSFQRLHLKENLSKLVLKLWAGGRLLSGSLFFYSPQSHSFRYSCGRMAPIPCATDRRPWPPVIIGHPQWPLSQCMRWIVGELFVCVDVPRNPESQLSSDRRAESTHPNQRHPAGRLLSVSLLLTHLIRQLQKLRTERGDQVGQEVAGYL